MSGEDSKSGCAPEDALALAVAMATLPGLRLRGLMCIPEPTHDTALQRARFNSLRQLHGQIRQALAGVALPTATAATVSAPSPAHGTPPAGPAAAGSPPSAAACFDTLSMGMSDDLEAAIAAGATLVRIGTALFGPRPPKPAGDTPQNVST